MTTIVSLALRDLPAGERVDATIWRRLLDRVVEGRQRRAAVWIAEHVHRREDSFRLEFERRLLGQ
jgi:hypothetical protein